MYNTHFFLKPFLLPGGLIFIGLLIAFVLLLKNKIKIVKLVLITLLVFYYLLAIEPISGILANPFKQIICSKINNNEEVEAIVVLAGFPVEGSLWDLDSNALCRIFKGIQVYKDLRGEMPIIFSSGNPYPFFQIEGIENKKKDFIDTVTSFGVLEKDIILEGNSKDTFENCVETKKILNKMYPHVKNHTVVLVTSPLHQLRASAIFKKQGFEIRKVSSRSNADKGSQNVNHITYYDFIPNAETFMQSNNAIYELFGLLYYKITGRISLLSKHSNFNIS